MTSPLLDPSDLGTYLGADVDTARAEQILDMAQKLCESVVSPLPDGAEAVVLDVAVRAWANPQNIMSESVGPFSGNFGRVGDGGLWLTRQNIATLRRLAGMGGAFTIDVLPATAGQNLPWWDAGGEVFFDGDQSGLWP